MDLEILSTRHVLGSTLGLADPTGTVQTTYSFDPFGNTTESGSSSSNSFAYTGREIDFVIFIIIGLDITIKKTWILLLGDDEHNRPELVARPDLVA
jgi:hypothetical protein